MQEKKFSGIEAVKYGWSVMKGNSKFFIGLLIVIWVINYGFSFLQGLPGEARPVVTIILAIISGAVQVFIGMGLIRISLKLCKNEAVSFKDLIDGKKAFFDYLIASVLYGLMVMIGMIALIVPGIIAGIIFQFCGYFVIDKGCGPIEALKKSAAITKGARWDLFVFGLLLLGVNALGFLALIIGLFATVPTTMIAAAYVYRILEGGDKISIAEEPVLPRV